ncbi:MerR family transcriptional regulator [Mycobacterium sp. CVI_P3]|uniref:MerR family transcriptional regulator n=1 Tax=Mycobacterium pinniadriaticum TaxID=2994102 RepID=A0ABT3SIR8_9MYCO|nr:MerR family transcriptional regulator [Mycobacterium pinniadriaticum]MCX2932975.1 MerR family transcriptional regulator [Mycobacterium pinniadriaticum]MCX2939353.1 MerR family transcriptional regulator [Mycobacterium pinniadriaticum]
MPTTPVTRDLSIQEVSRQTGLAESALRYYERIGLIHPVPHDASSGHRRYPPDLVAAVEALSCLRSTGMSVHDMRAYTDNLRRGAPAAADQYQLFAAHAQRLADDIARLRLRQRYVAAKARMWAARVNGDVAAEQDVSGEVMALAEQLLPEEKARA